MSNVKKTKVLNAGRNKEDCSIIMDGEKDEQVEISNRLNKDYSSKL